MTMGAAPLIAAVGHVAIRVTDLDAAARFATDVVGLSISERSETSVCVTCDTNHHNIEYILGTSNAVDHVGLVARDRDAIDEVRGRVEAIGCKVISDGPLGPGIADGFAFEAPGRFVIEIYSRMDQVVPSAEFSGVRPNRFGHVNFFLGEAAAMESLLREQLDFRVSDSISEAGSQLGTFLRCNADHHGIGVFGGGGGKDDRLNHYAWEVTSLAELGALSDLLDRRGETTLWGPVRHGMGRNIAVYIQEPSGLVVEYYCDMQRIYDEANYEPGSWSAGQGHKWYSLWAPGFPEDFMALGLPSYAGVVAAGA